MAVYERRYAAYAGPLVSKRRRILVIPRYAYEAVFASRRFLAFILACFAPSVLAVGLIFLQHNLRALQLLGIPVSGMVPIDAAFFDEFLSVQRVFAFVLCLVIGPQLIAPDLQDNALALVLSRPVSRVQYVVGKLLVLAFLLSAITWVPGLLLVGLKATLAGPEWLAANAWLAGPIIGASLTTIALLALPAMAISAWLRWRPAASAAYFSFFLVSAGLGNMANEVLGTRWGTLIDLREMMERLSTSLFALPTPGTPPLAAGWLAVLGVAAASVILLNLKLRAYQVVE